MAGYLITGGGGNLACQLSFERQGHRVLLLDIAERPIAPVAQSAEYRRGDLTDFAALDKLIADERPGTIVHFAALLSGKSEQDRPAAWKLNMDASFTLFESALRAGVKSVFFPSSVASYGGNLPCPVPEDEPQWPEGLYGVTKASVERLGFYYHRKHGLDFRCLRVPIVVSPFAPPGAASAYVSNAFIEAVRTGRFVFRVRPETRPVLIYTKDVIRAIVALLAAPAARLTRRAYNVHALAPTARELAESIRSRLPAADIRFDPDPEIVRLIDSWPAEFVDDSARKDWDWRPEYDLDRLADDFIQELRGGT